MAREGDLCRGRATFPKYLASSQVWSPLSLQEPVFLSHSGVCLSRVRASICTRVFAWVLVSKYMCTCVSCTCVYSQVCMSVSVQCVAVRCSTCDMCVGDTYAGGWFSCFCVCRWCQPSEQAVVLKCPVIPLPPLIFYAVVSCWISAGYLKS